MLPHNTMVVVADGHSATIYRNTAKNGIELSQTDQVTPASLTKPSQMAIPDEAAPNDENDEAAFAVDLTHHLNTLMLQQGMDDVAIIADPSTLGVMRKHYHKELQLRLRKEIAKTMTNSDIPSIQTALQ
ncbi:baeRF12 domain-containing protein [Paracoccus sediminilitoris]|uniref:baeRF12 domain-containing protein n=1 Tax=Paracoccus sediminilitoris TaxID=2202419 RepID=UPI001314764E|nr:host attachment protein [Paracoccus sediminilitoris]